MAQKKQTARKHKSSKRTEESHGLKRTMKEVGHSMKEGMRDVAQKAEQMVGGKKR